MGIIRVIFELLILYLVYKLIFDFIIPVYKTTRQVNKKMGEMQRKMNDHFNEDQAAAQNPAKKPGGPPKEDYIEFEEVR